MAKAMSLCFWYESTLLLVELAPKELTKYVNRIALKASARPSHLSTARY